MSCKQHGRLVSGGIKNKLFFVKLISKLLDDATGEMIPPERAERVPDYHVGSDHMPKYVSPRLCGKLFREFQGIDNAMKISEEKSEQYKIEVDESIRVDGFEEYMEDAKKQLASYNGQLKVSGSWNEKARLRQLRILSCSI